MICLIGKENYVIILIPLMYNMNLQPAAVAQQGRITSGGNSFLFLQNQSCCSHPKKPKSNSRLSSFIVMSMNSLLTAVKNSSIKTATYSSLHSDRCCCRADLRGQIILPSLPQDWRYLNISGLRASQSARFADNFAAIKQMSLSEELDSKDEVSCRGDRLACIPLQMLRNNIPP